MNWLFSASPILNVLVLAVFVVALLNLFTGMLERGSLPTFGIRRVRAWKHRVMVRSIILRRAVLETYISRAREFPVEDLTADQIRELGDE